jgi:hypothetical protein
LNVSFLGGYDDNVSAAAGGIGPTPDPRLQQSSALGNGQVSLTYRHGRDANWVRAGARAGFAYYAQAGDMNSGDYAASFGTSRRAGRRWLLTADLNASYLPYFVPRPMGTFVPDFGGTLPPPTSDFGVLRQSSLAYGGNGSLTYDIARRTRVYLDYRFYGMGVVNGGSVNQRQRSGGGGFNRDLTRRTSLGARYSYDQSESAYLGPRFSSQSHTATLTFAYRRPLLGRRAISFGLDPGFSRVEYERAIGSRVENRPSLAGRARVDIGRNWWMSADYQRGVVLVPGISRPYFADTAQGSLTGLLNRRVDTTVSFGYSTGVPGAVGANAYTTLNATAQVRAAINRLSALSVDYIRYRYEFNGAAIVPEEFAPRANRNGIRIGLAIWLPLSR